MGPLDFPTLPFRTHAALIEIKWALSGA
jgi:hypothetical protein